MHKAAGPEQSDIRWLQHFDNLERALAQRQAAIAAHQARPENALWVIALIKAYEFCFEPSWIDMLEQRNLMAHTYIQTRALQAAELINHSFWQAFQALQRSQAQLREGPGA